MKKILLAAIASLVALSSAAQAFTPEPITPPASLDPVPMTANVTSMDWSYTVENEVWVGYEGNDCYIQGLIADFPDAWLHGKVSGSTITFPQGQFIDYFGSDGYSYELYACGFTTADDKRCDYVLQRDAETGVLTSPKGMGLGEFMEDYGSYYTLDRLINITITPSDGEPAGEATYVPDGVEMKPYTLSAEDFRNGMVDYEAYIGFDGDDVYLADFCEASVVAGTCVKGYRSDEETIVFPSEQFIDRADDTYDLYFYGAVYDEETGKLTTGDLILDYDEQTDTYHNRFTGILISVGKITTTEIQFLEFMQDVVLFGQGESDAVTAPLVHDSALLRQQPAYLLDGRSASTSLPHGACLLRRMPDGSYRKVAPVRK